MGFLNVEQAAMMARENEFEPRLGKIRSLGTKKGRKYLHQILAAVNLAGRGTSGRGAFHGNRIGRGCGVGRVLASRDRFAAYRHRRVIIKSRIVRLAGKGIAGARAHLRYIQRDGVTRDGRQGGLYGAREDAADGKAFHERSAGDRHQFRFIVSPEDGGDYESLRSLTRRLMERMEEDLGTKLDWVAVDHFNTGHPHTHVMLRGADERGRDLVIARDYMSTGMRERAAELVQLDLGPRTDMEIQRRLAAEVEQERLTGLDRQLLSTAAETGIITPNAASPARQTLLVGRLRKLEHLGLATEEMPGRWRVAAELDLTLRRLGERGDIIKTMHREMGRANLQRAPAELAVFDPGAAEHRAIVGKVVARGLSDELRDRHYLIVDGTDGRTHYIDIGKADAVEPLSAGSIVQVEAKLGGARRADRTIAEIAAANGGRYTADLHLHHDPAASQAFAETHVRRLEVMRRVMGSVEREADGTWIIAPDHVDRAAAFEQRQARERPVAVTLLSQLPLEQQVGAEGATWLDRELAASAPEPLRDSGFGKSVREAQLQRSRWLLARGLADEAAGDVICRPDMLDVLRRRELLRVAGQLAEELGLEYRTSISGDRVAGTYKRSIDLASGRYAVIERSRDFTMVPWRPVLEGRQGQPISGIVRPDGISWSVGRSRSGPQVS